MIEIPDISAALHGLLRQIPRGRVTTFGDLAEALGDLSAARWVAGAMTDCPELPAHRVVKRTGEIPLANTGRSADRRARLLSEGIPCSESSIADMAAFRWREFVSDAPLKRLAEWQETIAQRARNDEDLDVPNVIGGLDISYVTDHEAVAAYVEIETSRCELLYSTTCRAEVSFPYLTGYLTFRELPLHLELLAKVRKEKPLAKVILMDGAGQLHPRRCGIAVAVGVETDCVTVGVAKHHLCGRKLQDDPQSFLEWNGDVLGRMLYCPNGRHPAYVSPGQGISLAAAVRCVQAVWPDGRSPRPIHVADQLSRQVARQG